ncbi:hypothetical protein V6N12_064366 [Hibiscus sabdariffa]|uniref:NB-ARC domain-containing protein n=1 Tax=Hibiscus sabdariffa TaxID=183260 RepID=A0ABR2G5L1_9ROSI
MKLLLESMRSFLIDADRFGTGSQTQKNKLGESSLFFKDDDLVGIKKAQHELLGWLMADQPQRTVISVVGMGGSGKTTLVANTFNKQIVKQHFEFYSWITVSQQYAIEELFRSIVKDIYNQTTGEVPQQVDTLTYRGLVETLVQFLQSRRYLVVLDDVWSIRVWQEINIAFAEGIRGGKVVVTTRREDAVPCQSGFVSHVHQIQPLRMKDAWELFCKKAFPNRLGGCPSHLDESLARNLVEKCEGLLLAIATLGGLMSSKKLITEWKRVRDNLARELNNNPSLEIMKAMSMLSYHDLPFQLKQCFLYCSLFPEDYEIARKRLMRLWTAEGFLESANEAVAESYLMELISRSLLQVTERNEFGRPRKFKIVFDLENAPIDEVPSEFGELFNLRYLNLSRTQVKVLPKSIGKLFNLQSLLLKYSQIVKLPNEIVKLQNLRHLSAFYLVKSELRIVRA